MMWTRTSAESLASAVVIDTRHSNLKDYNITCARYSLASSRIQSESSESEHGLPMPVGTCGPVSTSSLLFFHPADPLAHSDFLT